MCEFLPNCYTNTQDEPMMKCPWNYVEINVRGASWRASVPSPPGQAVPCNGIRVCAAGRVTFGAKFPYKGCENYQIFRTKGAKIT